ncbi:MAG TPA: hypothetical protein DDZ51_27205 [Planctomycetaceae bacterium]|nr:hypothetical protein [Planctomycetaceae bacterium]
MRIKKDSSTRPRRGADSSKRRLLFESLENRRLMTVFGTLSLPVVSETESAINRNDSFAQAQTINLSPINPNLLPGSRTGSFGVDLQGTAGSAGAVNTDIDVFRVSLRKGEVFDLALTGTRGGSSPISQVTVFHADTFQPWFALSGNASVYPSTTVSPQRLSVYPPGSPLQSIGNVPGPIFAGAQVVPATGDYFVQLNGDVSGRGYELAMRTHLPGPVSRLSGAVQYVFIDYNDQFALNTFEFSPQRIDGTTPFPAVVSSRIQGLQTLSPPGLAFGSPMGVDERIRERVVDYFADIAVRSGFTLERGDFLNVAGTRVVGTQLTFRDAAGQRVGGIRIDDNGADPTHRPDLRFGIPTTVYVGQDINLQENLTAIPGIDAFLDPLFGSGVVPANSDTSFTPYVDIGNFNGSLPVFVDVRPALAQFPPTAAVVPGFGAGTIDVVAQGVASSISRHLARSFGAHYTAAAFGGVPSLMDQTFAVPGRFNLVGTALNGAISVNPPGGTVSSSAKPYTFPAVDANPQNLAGTRMGIVNGNGFSTDNRTIAQVPATFPLFGRQNVGNTLVSGLSTGRGTVAATISVTNNGVGVAGVVVYNDSNGDGIRNIFEEFGVTNASGRVELRVSTTPAALRVIPPAGMQVVGPSVVNLTSSGNVNFQLAAGTGGGDTPGTPGVSTGTGRIFSDFNANGIREQGEPGIGEAFVFIDLDGDTRIDIGEPRATTNADGTYTLNFSDLTPGRTYRVYHIVQPGFELISPASGFYEFVYNPLSLPTGFDFANRPSRDFGDAPNSYMTTLASGGPSHGIVPGLSLGQRVDRDLDGQPSPLADGDDLGGPVGAGGVVLDDEDGIRQLTPIAPGTTATFEVSIVNTTGQTGFLQAWFDFDKNGTFSGLGEQVLRNVVLPAGTNQVQIPIPVGVTTGNLMTRWRYSLTADLGIGGAANSGEVEDHLFTVQPQARVANDDVAMVSRNSQANAINVLTNDFQTPENRLRVTGIDRFALGTRGQVTIGTGGQTVFYTPPTGFVGQDRFTYTVTPDFGPSATATVTVNVTFQSDVPVALDDTVEVAQGSNNIAINVLDNDLPSTFGGISIISVTPGTQGGTTSLAGGNQSVRYTPRAGFAGTEQFTYTISDAAGSISSATATINLLPGSRSDDVVAFNVVFLDVINGQPITDIQAGTEFLARVTVEDVRSTFNQTGVFSAFLDLLYTDELVAVVPSASNPLGFAVEFGNRFQSGLTGVQTGDANTPGVLNEMGSTRRLDSMPGPGEGPLELFTVRFQAISPGIAVFASNPADRPVSETTVFNRMTELAVNELRLGISELVISPSGGPFTSAIDDAFPDGFDSNRVRITGGQTAQLNVIANDLLGPTNAISEFFIINRPNFGQVTTDLNGRFVSYRPDDSIVNRFDSFTYGIVTQDGVRSTAEVTLFVGDPVVAQNTAPSNNKPFDVDVSLRVVDGQGNTLSRIVPGSRFGVQVIVQDLRAPSLQANPLGVFAAFSDILYDAGLARPSNQIQNDPFDFDVIFANNFGIVGAFGKSDRAGIIDEFGSFLTNTTPSNNPPNPSLTGQPVVMATLFFDAIGTGPLRLVTSPADASPFRDTLLFQPAAPVPVSRIRYNVTSIDIGGGSGEGESLQNALLPADVNGDGQVTPIDALSIINQISRIQSGVLGESAANLPNLFSDVNADGLITPLDALLVLTYIGSAQRGDVPIDLTQLSALLPNADGVIPVDSYAALYELLSGRFTGGAEGEGETDSAASVPALMPSSPSASDGEEDEDSLLGLLADDVASLWK